MRTTTGLFSAFILGACHGKDEGTPLPAAVMRSEDGVTSIVLDGATRDGVTSRTLALKATGRPATPLVLADGRPKS